MQVGVVWGSQIQEELTHVVHKAAFELVDGHGYRRMPAQNRDHAFLAAALLQALVNI